MRKRQYGHRQFLKWLRSERNRFLNPPIVTRSGYNRTEFLFKGIHTTVRGSYMQQSRTYSGISVWATCGKNMCDFLFDLDLKENRAAEGYTCSLCLPEFTAYYPTRTELWHLHSFEPFLEWCNGTLSQSNWLATYGNEGHWAVAQLLREQTDATLSNGVFIPLNIQKKEGA